MTEENEPEVALDEEEAPEITCKQRTLDILKFLAKRWFIDAFGGMALGLFCTLIAGTILGSIGSWFNEIKNGNFFGYWLINIANCAKTLMGAGIGTGIAFKLQVKSPLILFSGSVSGLVGAFALSNTGAISIFKKAFTIKLGAPGNPIGAYVVALFGIELTNLYAGMTKIDIILIPLGMMISSMVGMFIAWPFVKIIYYVGVLIEKIVKLNDVAMYLMAILVSFALGMLLTFPTSSAAIWVAIVGGLTDADGKVPKELYIAGGAAVAGCASHMVGFAVASFRENRWAGLISQGIGTSMLQIPNIMKRPIILVPVIVASVITGPIAVAFGLLCDASGGGMGTSGLVGVIQTISISLDNKVASWRIGLGVPLTLIILPAVIALVVSEFMRKKGWIVEGDMALD